MGVSKLPNGPRLLHPLQVSGFDLFLLIASEKCAGLKTNLILCARYFRDELTSRGS